ncbi:Hypothetical Protein FCC1311_079272 [Hondaea fermentalgiana]|uniref:Uncharacterized protein n=1 Tax=Hondaea fermentalgiana TaxID=2315210 RepID=A0A2R5GLB6_9STRA|nr:Hypothetical Protein FCC1311_079272 [Hondaea fermentalgiana]|eukprot:GBG31702.1 Hypothetical Protein FCC1311_079272 [Hondaea fermentalgiana]
MSLAADADSDRARRPGSDESVGADSSESGSTSFVETRSDEKTATMGASARQVGLAEEDLVDKRASVRSINSALERQGSIILEKGEEATLPQQVFIVLLVIATALLFLFLFSGLPYCLGETIYVGLSSVYNLFPYVFLGSLAAATFLYIFDVRFWRGPWMYLGILLVAGTVLGFSTAMLLATRDYVVAPIAVFLFGAPFLFLSLKVTIFTRMDAVHLLNALCAGLWLVFALALGLWLSWIIVEDNWWDLKTRVDFYKRMDCSLKNSTSTITLDELTDEVISSLSTEAYAEADAIVAGCTSAFVLWLLPFILSLWAFTFSGVLYFIARALEQSRSATANTRSMDPLAQAFLMFVSLGLLGIYMASGIAGAEMAITNMVLALGFLALVIAAIVVVAVFGWAKVTQNLMQTPLGNRLLEFASSDWVKAMMLMLISPVFLLYLVLSVFTQANRKMWSCTKPLEPEHRSYMITANAHEMFQSVRAWNWSSVLIKVLWLGVLFFLFSVGVTRLTTLFLSWLNGELASVSFGITTVIFFLVGICMFLLPPVPGVPVYVSGGIILVSGAEPTLGFWGGIAFTMAICFSLKMLAIVIQQKYFGEHLASTRVWVRSFVGVNSIEMRAIREILLKPGLTLPKVSVLCGGPDWPTSVTTGILRLSLVSMLIGSLPIIFLIAPCVLAGAMLLRANEGGIWSSLSTMTLALAVVTQAGAMLIAVHFIAKTSVEKREELMQIPPDEEVLKLERNSERRNKLYSVISSWEHSGYFLRFMLVFSALCMTISCYMFQLLGSYCFVSFEVSDSIENDLGGNALNIVKPLGWYALLLFAFPTCFLILYRCYMNHMVSMAYKQPDHWAQDGKDMA